MTKAKAKAPVNVDQEAEGLTDFIDKVVSIKRVAKVTKGGRRFSIRAVAVAGNGKGMLGVGTGKATEAPNAIKKATTNARRNMKRINLNGNTLHHEIVSRHGATKVWMKPASEGTGIIAGSALRGVFEVIGVKNVLTKVIGSSNPVNVINATVKGLLGMVTPEAIARKRTRTIKEVVDGVE